MLYIILIMICLVLGTLLIQMKKNINELAINNTILSNEIEKLKKKIYL